MGFSLIKYAVIVVASASLFAGCSGAGDGDLNGPDAAPDAADDAAEDAPVDLPSIRINEVAAGEAPDWVELVNIGEVAVDLTALRILDANDPEMAVAFATSGNLEPGAYIAFDIADETVGFKLGGDEEVWLYTAAGDVVDSVDWNEGDAATGKSFARQPNGTGDFVTVDAPSKGVANP